MAWAAVAGVAGSVIAGSMAADAAGDASSMQSAAGQRAIEEQRRTTEQQRTDLAPWRRQGESALNRINALYGFPQGDTLQAPDRADFTSTSRAATPTNALGQKQATLYSGLPDNRAQKAMGRQHILGQRYAGQSPPQYTQSFDKVGYDAAQADYQSQLAQQQEQQANYNPQTAAQDFLQMDPGYQFRLSEGNKALQNNLLARSGALSGKALKAGLRYGQNMASQEFGSAFNRLAGLSASGQNAATQQATFSGQQGSNVGNLMTQQGNAQAAGAIGASNAWGNAIEQGASLYGQYDQNRRRNERPSLAGY